MKDSQIYRRFLQWVALPTVLLMYCLTAWADANDPILPGPKSRGAAEGIGVGSLVDTVIMATPKKDDGTGGDVIVWGLRSQGMHGNEDYYGSSSARVALHPAPASYTVDPSKNAPALETVKAFKDPSHALYGQKVMRLVTSAHTAFALTEEGEVWAWGMNATYGVVGCKNTGYETNGPNTSSQQHRPCPVFTPRDLSAWGAGKRGEILDRVVWIDAGEYNVVAYTVSGKIYTWGSGAFYQTTTNTSHKHTPFDITHFFKEPDGTPLQIAWVGAAYEGGYALTYNADTEQYRLWGWGRSFGQSLRKAGSGTDVYQDISVHNPEPLPQYDEYAKNIAYVNGGYGWTAALLRDGRVIASGLKRHAGVGTYPNGVLGDNSHNYYEPRVIMGPGSEPNCWDPDTKTKHACPKVSRLITRYAGAVVVPEDNDEVIYTWGGNHALLYHQVYGSVPVIRKLAGKLKGVGATKEAVYYLTEDNKLYGVGYSNMQVMNLCDDYTRSWDRNRNQIVRKNSMNWTRTNSQGKLVQGGYRIPYEDWIDKPYSSIGLCDNGTVSGVTRTSFREWTGYDDRRDGVGPFPTSYGVGACAVDNNNC